MSDPWPLNRHAGSGPLSGSMGQITPHDTNDLTVWTRQIKITTSGNLVVVWADGTETTEAVTAGEVYDWRIKRVKSTGTTAVARGYY